MAIMTSGEAGRSRLVNHDQGDAQPIGIRQAVTQLADALRDCANGAGGNELERRYSEARGRLLLDGRLMRMMPKYLTECASASGMVETLSEGAKRNYGDSAPKSRRQRTNQPKSRSPLNIAFLHTPIWFILCDSEQ